MKHPLSIFPRFRINKINMMEMLIFKSHLRVQSGLHLTWKIQCLFKGYGKSCGSSFILPDILLSLSSNTRFSAEDS